MCQLESSLSTTRVRQRLCDLMGTDVIRLNDKRYFQQLSERLQEEYETYMDKQEDARCAAEEQRIRRLMLEGVIKAPNDYRAVVHGERIKKSTKKKKKRRSKKRSTDGSSAYTSDGISSGFSRHSDDGKQEKELVTQVSMLSDTRPGSSGPVVTSKRPSSGIRLTSPQPSNSNSYEKENKKIELHVRPPHHDSIRPSSSASMHRKSRRAKSASSRLVHWDTEQPYDGSDDDDTFDTKSLPVPSRPPSKFSKHEPKLIKTLRQEETVAGLYSLAEELVSPVKTEELVGKAKSKKY